MTKNQIIALQKRIGTIQDGFWGRKSIEQCQKHLLALMSKKNDSPTPDEVSLQKFYGSPGDESKLVAINVAGLGIQYDGKKVKSIRCHSKCAESLEEILEEIAQSNFAWILKEFAGCYNNRPMRGSNSRPSLHARGAAIDLAPATNGNRTSWPVNSTMPIEVAEMFSKRNWLSAGVFWGRDAMHFQKTK
jgi:hypothetical protein